MRGGRAYFRNCQIEQRQQVDHGVGRHEALDDERGDLAHPELGRAQPHQLDRLARQHQAAEERHEAAGAGHGEKRVEHADMGGVVEDDEAHRDRLALDQALADRGDQPDLGDADQHELCDPDRVRRVQGAVEGVGEGDVGADECGGLDRRLRPPERPVVADMPRSFRRRCHAGRAYRLRCRPWTSPATSAARTRGWPCSTPAAAAPVAVEVYSSRDHDGLEAMLRAFLKAHPAQVERACFGVAGPVQQRPCADDQPGVAGRCAAASPPRSAATGWGS